MHIEQLYTKCLAHAAYYIEDNGEAAVIDPLRDDEQYLAIARARGAKIKYVIETHFHADFVSGHIDLSEHSGAKIIFGPNATPGYTAHIATDMEELPLGHGSLQILHTPGHTVESICILAKNAQGKAEAVFTGDTLFVGDVGRPDLLSGNHTKEELAEMMYHSLQDKIMTLDDAIIVYPGHGAGSACGKNIGKETYSTIGDQKRSNYALLEQDKAKFIAVVTANLPTPPSYFFTDAGINKNGYKPIQEVIAENSKALTASELQEHLQNGVTILDTRDASAFGAGYINGSINIGLTGDFAIWVGAIMAIKNPIALIVDEGKATEAVTRLARIGFEQVKGYLAGGTDSWLQAGLKLDVIPTMNSNDCLPLIDQENYQVLDVRNRTEVAKNRWIGSQHICLTELRNKLQHLNKYDKWMVYCAGGYRSMIAASLLKAHGFVHVINIEGGIKHILAQTPEVVDLMEQE